MTGVQTCALPIWISDELNLLGRATARYLKAHPAVRTRVKLYEGSVLLLPEFLQNRMDVVYMASVIATEHFSNTAAKRAYLEIAQTLAPDGVLVTGRGDQREPNELYWSARENPFQVLLEVSIEKRQSHSSVYAKRSADLLAASVTDSSRDASGTIRRALPPETDNAHDASMPPSETDRVGEPIHDRNVTRREL